MAAWMRVLASCGPAVELVVQACSTAGVAGVSTWPQLLCSRRCRVGAAVSVVCYWGLLRGWAPSVIVVVCRGTVAVQAAEVV